jgi:TonB family protein
MHPLIEISIYTAIFYMAFKFVIKRFINTSIRRWIILSIPIFSVLILYIKQMALTPVVTIALPGYVLDVFDTSTAISSSQKTTFFSIEFIYYIGLSITFLLLIYKLTSLLYQFKKAEKKKENGVHISLNDKQDNFSFFNWISMDKNLTESERDIVLKHELLHVKKHHSLDVIYLELFKVTFWFNPFIYLLKSELETIHEEEVDAEMYKHHGDNYIEFMLTQSFQVKFNLTQLHNPFFNSKFNLKNRINIMKTQRKNYLLVLLFLPVIAGVLSFTSVNKPTISETIKQVAQPNDSQKNVILSDTTYAEYKGGFEELYTFLSQNVTYPDDARKDSIQGKVFVGFIISEEGKVENPWIWNEGKTHPSLEKEAIRVVKKMPDWEPARTEGKAIKSEYTIPINFTFN